MAIMDRVRRGQHDLGGLDPRPAAAGQPWPRPRPGAPAAAGRGAARPRGGADQPPAHRSTTYRHTQPHDLESLLWSLGPEAHHRGWTSPAAVDEPATRRLDEPPTRALRRRPHGVRRPGAEPSAVPDPTAGGPGRTRAGAGTEPDPAADPYGADWIPASWEDQPQRASAAERFRRAPAGRRRAGRPGHRRRRRSLPHPDRARGPGRAAARHVPRPAPGPPTGGACAAASGTTWC